MTSAAHAQDSAKDHVEPRLTRAQYTAFVRQLNLDSDQRMIAELLFADYAADLDALTADLEQQALDAGLHEVQAALSGRGRLSTEELKAKRVAVLRVYQQGWAAVDEAMDRLTGGVGSVLTQEQRPMFEPALRELRRVVFLHPRQADRDYQEYAGDGVDVLLLVEAAMGEGGELQALGFAPLNNVLYQYELRLDALLRATAADYRNTKIERKIAAIERDQAALREVNEDAIARWKQLFELNQQAVQQIGAIVAANLGEAAKQRWLDRFDQASFAWLYPRRKPDRQIEWMRQQSLPPETLEQAETMYERYLAQRRELSRQAIDLMLRARLEFQTMLYAMMDPSNIDDRLRRGLYEELLKNSGEQANLESSTAAALEGLLSSSQRDALRRAMERPDRRR